MDGVNNPQKETISTNVNLLSTLSDKRIEDSVDKTLDWISLYLVLSRLYYDL